MNGGEYIPKDYSHATHRYVALSKDLLKSFPFGSYIRVIGADSTLDGTYIVKDKLNNRFTKRIDFLVARNDDIKGLWKCKIALQEDRM